MGNSSVEEMRYALSTVYSGPRWKNKVDDMSDNQVIAVYYDFAKRGKFDKKSKNDDGQKHSKNSGKKSKPLDNGYYYEQMTIDGKWERRYK